MLIVFTEPVTKGKDPNYVIALDGSLEISRMRSSSICRLAVQSWNLNKSQ